MFIVIRIDATKVRKLAEICNLCPLLSLNLVIGSNILKEKVNFLLMQEVFPSFPLPRLQKGFVLGFGQQLWPSS